VSAISVALVIVACPAYFNFSSSVTFCWAEISADNPIKGCTYRFLYMASRGGGIYNMDMSKNGYEMRFIKTIL